MLITISKQTLATALSQAVRFIPKKAELAVLTNFLFEIDGNQMQITASNAESRFTTSVECKSKETFRMCFPVTALDALKKLPEQPVTIDSDGRNTTVNYSGGSFEICCDDPSAYPAKYEQKYSTTQVAIEASLLASGIGSVVECTSTDMKTRPVINCVSIQIEGGKVSFYGTDTHIMGAASFDVAGQPDTKMLISRINATSLKSILESCDGMAEITVGDRWTDFALNGMTISLRNLEHKTPNYRSIVPKSFKINFTESQSSLIDCIERVRCFSDSLGMVSFDMTSDSLVISSQDIDFSVSAKEERHVETGCTAKFSINLLSSNLLTVLKGVGSGNVIFSMNDAKSAVLIKPEKLQDECEKFYIVMPMLKM